METSRGGARASKRTRAQTQAQPVAQKRQRADDATQPADPSSQDVAGQKSDLQRHPDSSSTPSVPPAAIARYKAWRSMNAPIHNENLTLTGWLIEAGSPHDPNCFECSLPGDVDPCKTCRLSWHEKCKSLSSKVTTKEGRREWHCDMCVDRGWHIASPPLTPPASPTLAPRTLPGVEPQSTAPIIANPPIQPQPQSGSGRSTQARLAPIQSRTPLPVKDATIPERSVDPKTAHPQRKSRYNTLPTDVDAALTVLYRELESVPVLQRKVIDLETEMSRMRQSLAMQNNELIMTRRAADKAQELEGELEKLRAEARHQTASAIDTKALQNENEKLSVELSEMREELRKSNETVQRWKQKLSSMMDD